jgi:Transposase
LFNVTEDLDVASTDFVKVGTGWVITPLPREFHDVSPLYTQIIRQMASHGLRIHSEAFTAYVYSTQTWIETVLTSGLPDLKRFATGLQQDAAVRAAFELPYSNGQTEGQVTRLKLLKRQMYGRAKLALLRQRVLHAA